MEYLPGIKITDVEKLRENGFEPKKLAETLIKTFLDIMLKYGYVHADPHPGNISVNKKGQLILYDYGVVAKVRSDIQSSIKDLCLAFFEKDVERLMNILLSAQILFAQESGATSVDNLSDYEYVSLYKLMVYIIEYTESVDINKLNTQLVTDSNLNTRDIPFMVNKEILILFKTITVLEGVCKTLDPTFSYNEIFQQSAMEFLDTEMFMNKITNDFKTVFMNNQLKKEISSERMFGMRLQLMKNSVENNNKWIIFTLFALLINYVF
jgi:predicted unusual protein kinase regulating ubiquinone biosynthesis (AarF/ABC1/UbiB family)